MEAWSTRGSIQNTNANIVYVQVAYHFCIDFDTPVLGEQVICPDLICHICVLIWAIFCTYKLYLEIISVLC